MAPAQLETQLYGPVIAPSLRHSDKLPPTTGIDIQLLRNSSLLPTAENCRITILADETKRVQLLRTFIILVYIVIILYTTMLPTQTEVASPHIPPHANFGFG